MLSHSDFRKADGHAATHDALEDACTANPLLHLIDIGKGDVSLRGELVSLPTLAPYPSRPLFDFRFCHLLAGDIARDADEVLVLWWEEAC